MRDGANCQGFEPLRVGSGHMPRDDCTPVVADEMESAGAQGVCHTDDVTHEPVDGVFLDPLRSRVRRVATLFGRHRKISGRRQRVHLAVPLPRGLGEAVQQEHEFPSDGPALRAGNL
jgi:hypothetical protein